MPVYTQRQQHFDRACDGLSLAVTSWRREFDMSSPEAISALLKCATWVNGRDVRDVHRRIEAKRARKAATEGEGEEGGSGE